MTSEAHAKHLERCRQWYLKNREHHMAKNALRNLHASVNPHGPDDTKAIRKQVRLRCLQMGGDPGSTHDIKMAMLEIGYESPELQRGIFHPDYLARTASSWSGVWRRMRETTKQRLLEEFNLTQVDCPQFEPLQPEQT